MCCTCCHSTACCLALHCVLLSAGLRCSHLRLQCTTGTSSLTCLSLKVPKYVYTRDPNPPSHSPPHHAFLTLEFFLAGCHLKFLQHILEPLALRSKRFSLHCKFGRKFLVFHSAELTLRDISRSFFRTFSLRPPPVLSLFAQFVCCFSIPSSSSCTIIWCCLLGTYHPHCSVSLYFLHSLPPVMLFFFQRCLSPECEDDPSQPGTSFTNFRLAPQRKLLRRDKACITV